ncbi:cytochrome P450 2C15-like [Protopterus annectens]|uniref:cytochrome P450 2C15-like n=1 Tax=Protopterus annectens TaxID=7888 RepID=UPI001CFA6606|nr:cytochrome P450 2C15-like [Protopterus annectens]
MWILVEYYQNEICKIRDSIKALDVSIKKYSSFQNFIELYNGVEAKADRHKATIISRKQSKLRRDIVSYHTNQAYIVSGSSVLTNTDTKRNKDNEVQDKIVEPGRLTNGEAVSRSTGSKEIASVVVTDSVDKALLAGDLNNILECKEALWQLVLGADETPGLNEVINLKCFLLAKIYGNTYSIFLGSKLIVVLNCFQSVKEALVNHAAEFSDRPEDPVFLKLNKNKGIITVPYGQQWKEQRRFVLMLLRNFGLGTKTMENMIIEEAKYLVKYFEDKNGCQFDPKMVLNTTASNIICSILFSQRFNYCDNTFSKKLELLGEVSDLIGGFWGELYNAVPVLRCLPLPFQNIFRNICDINFFLQNIIEEHKKSLIPGEPRDFLDCYLEEINKRKNDGSSFDNETLLTVMTELFGAGTDTTTHTLRWALLLMMAYPNVQEKCYKEIESITNGKEFVSYDDRLRIPYTQAVIHEVQRFRNVIPLGVPHATTKKVLFRGYTIPQGTRVITNLNSALCDETQWKFPQEFNPDNFPNDSGEFVKPEAFIPFSAGPRICLGENLARMEIFLFFTSLLKTCEVFWPEKSTAPNLTSTFSIVQSPYPFRVGLKSRKTC